MLARAVDQVKVPPQSTTDLARQLFPSSPTATPDTFRSGSHPSISWASFEARSPKSPSVSRGKVLKPSPSHVRNGPKSSSLSRAPLGPAKPMLSQPHGLASSDRPKASLQENKNLDLTVNRQRAGAIGSLHDSVFFNEDDFDDDINLDLDIEDPASKGFVTATSTVINSTTAKDLPIDQPSATPAGLGSSAPLAWSSSPLEHKTKPPATVAAAAPPEPSLGLLSDKRSSVTGVANPPAKKRRVLPWAQESAVEARVGPGSTTQARRDERRHTNLENSPDVHDSSRLPWDNTASAVKAQQKKLRESKKKSSKPREAGKEVGQNTSRKKKTKQVGALFLSEEQKRVIGLVVNEGKSVFFTGSAGTGKSVLLREIIAKLRLKFAREPDRVAVTASTGLAACNVGGVTLHSFSGIGLGKEPASELVKKIRKNPKAKQRWLRTAVLVIDEISMVDGILFDKLDHIGRTLRKVNRPFGGIQIVITGDFFQLPPVPERGAEAKFAFDASSWSEAIQHTIGLTHVFRQKDPVFAGMLNEMRLGRLTQDSINTFRTLSRPCHFDDNLEGTELFPTRAEVDHANNSRMKNLTGASMVFEAYDGGTIQDKNQRDKLLANCMAPVSLELRIGAQVMLIKNTDESLVNGSLGTVKAFVDEMTYEMNNRTMEYSTEAPRDATSDAEAPGPNPLTKFASELVGSTGKKWPLVEFAIPDGTFRTILVQQEMWKIELPNGEVQASRSQVPLILAWALSIHKAQGQTLERVKVDLGRVFEKGQAYVALSRATCQSGLQVLRFDPRKVMAHDRVRTFYDGLYTFSGGSSLVSKAPALAPPASRQRAMVPHSLQDDYDQDAEEAMGYA